MMSAKKKKSSVRTLKIKENGLSIGNPYPICQSPRTEIPSVAKCLNPLFNVWVNYYNEPLLLRRWLNVIQNSHKHDLPVHFNIIDDGSEIEPAINHIDTSTLFNTSLYRVNEDLGFNSHGCRNLAMFITTTEWNLLCDIDRDVSSLTLSVLVERMRAGTIKQGEYYVFRRLDKLDEAALNDFFIHKDDFWRAGGYDEEFTGIHYGDRIFLRQLDKYAQQTFVPDCFVEILRGGRDVKFCPDLKKTTYDDHTCYHPLFENVVKRPYQEIMDEIQLRNTTSDYSRKKIINFRWEQLF